MAHYSLSRVQASSLEMELLTGALHASRFTWVHCKVWAPGQFEHHRRYESGVTL